MESREMQMVFFFGSQCIETIIILFSSFVGFLTLPHSLIPGHRLPAWPVQDRGRCLGGWIRLHGKPLPLH